jgi:hypothetical protein
MQPCVRTCAVRCWLLRWWRARDALTAKDTSDKSVGAGLGSGGWVCGVCVCACVGEEGERRWLSGECSCVCELCAVCVCACVSVCVCGNRSPFDVASNDLCHVHGCQQLMPKTLQRALATAGCQPSWLTHTTPQSHPKPTVDLLTSPKTSDLHCAVLQTDFDFFFFFFPCRLPLCLRCVHCSVYVLIYSSSV